MRTTISAFLVASSSKAEALRVFQEFVPQEKRRAPIQARQGVERQIEVVSCHTVVLLVPPKGIGQEPIQRPLIWVMSVLVLLSSSPSVIAELGALKNFCQN
jgi:hypothetical protein